jgi:hypothetical protein
MKMRFISFSKSIKMELKVNSLEFCNISDCPYLICHGTYQSSIYYMTETLLGRSLLKESLKKKNLPMQL